MSFQFKHGLATRIYGGGLGNRIKRIVSALHNCQYVHTDDPIYNTIFELHVPQAIGEIDYQIFNDWRLQIYDLIPDQNNFGINNINCGEIELKKSKFSIDHEYFRIPPIARYRIASLFLKLGSKQFINQKVKQITSSWGANNVIGVHIRTWKQSPEWRKELTDLKKFETEIFRKLDDTYIYLATDCKSIEIYFRDLLGPRLIMQSDFYALPIERHVSMEATASSSDLIDTASSAYIDMLCLAKTTMIIGSYRSTFTECSWWLGGANQHIVIL